MYFRIEKLQNAWLLKCLKSPISEQPSKNQSVSNTAQIFMTTLQSYFLITLTEVELENVPFSDILNLTTVC